MILIKTAYGKVKSNHLIIVKQKIIFLILFFFSYLIHGQILNGEYVLNRKNFKITFFENNKFQKYYTVGFCGVGIHTEGIYKLEDNNLILIYEDFISTNPTVKKINPSKKIKEDIKTKIRISIYDSNAKLGADYRIIVNDKSFSYFYNSFSETFEIDVHKPYAKIKILNIDSDDVIYEFITDNIHDFDINIEVDLKKTIEERFKIVKNDNEKLILKTDLKKRLKLVLNETK